MGWSFLFLKVDLTIHLFRNANEFPNIVLMENSCIRSNAFGNTVPG